MATGVDVYSAYQTVHNWRAVRAAGYQFCYVKLSDGTQTRNEAGYTTGGKQTGMLMGGYHYAEPGDSTAQANLFLDRCEHFDALDLAPCVDVEAPFVPGPAAVSYAVAFVQRIRARGYRPCVYANNTMMRVLRAPVLAAVPDTVIWVARYGANPTVAHDLWQHSQSGTVPGIAARAVDLNTGTVPTNIRVNPTIRELIDMQLTDKVRYQNRFGKITEITVHDVLARISLLFEDQQFGAPGQRADGPWASVFRQLAVKMGIGVPK